jgi:RHS repeat-associated protein
VYQVQSRSNLTVAPWQTELSIMATGNCSGVSFPLLSPSARFFRLCQSNPPQVFFESPPARAPAEPCGGCGGGSRAMYQGVICVGPVRARPETVMYQGVIVGAPQSGEVVAEACDLTVKGRGMDFAWCRKYRSTLGPDTALGKQWDFSYNIWIQKCGNFVILHDGNTRQDVYLPRADGTYVNDEFCREGRFGGGGPGVFTLTFADTGIWQFRALDGSPAQGKIAMIQDRNLNALTFGYDSGGRMTTITDTLARNYTVAYNNAGLISSVADFAGNLVQYQHDGNGDLTTVVTPAVPEFMLGKTNTLTYSNHKLQTVTDGNGSTWMNNTYYSGPNPNDLSYGRVASIALGDSSQKIMFYYAAQTPASSNNFASLEVVVNDRDGGVSKYFYDAAGRLVRQRDYTGFAVPGLVTTDTANQPAGQLRLSDPAYFQTDLSWNPYSLLTGMIYPNGNSVVNTHAVDVNPAVTPRARASLLTHQEIAGPLGGDQATRTTTYGYDSNFFACGCGPSFATAITNANGHVTRYAYDAFGNRTNCIYPLTNIQENWQYNAFGQQIGHDLPDNGSGYKRHDAMYYYSGGTSNGYLRDMVTASGGLNISNHFEYNTIGDLLRSVDPIGRDTLYNRNARHQLVQKLSPQVQTTNGLIRYVQNFYYDGADNPNKTEVENVDQNGAPRTPAFLVTTNTYDNLHRLLRVKRDVDATHSVTTEFGYDHEGNQTLVRYPTAVSGAQTNNIVQTIPDERNMAFQVTRGGLSTVQYNYDPNGNASSTAEGLECNPRLSTTVYDGFNRPTSRTDPMGNVTTWHYDADGNVISERVDGELTDVPGSAGNVRLSEITYIYDPMDRLTNTDVAFFDPATQATIHGGHSITRTIYSDNSQVLRVINDNNHTNSTAYDTAYRPSLTADGRGNTVQLGYDNASQVLTRTNTEVNDLGGAQPYVTHYTYDGLGRTINMIDPVGNTTQQQWDSRNNLIVTIDPRGNVVSNSVDGLNRLVQADRFLTTSGDGTGAVTNRITTKQSWDDSSRLASQTDANTNTTAYAYDGLNRLVCTVFADGTSNCFTFDCHDNRATMTDANSSVATYLYDLNNRLTNTSVAVGPGVSAETTFERYQHDGLSRMVRAEDDDSVVTWAYDSLSNPMRETLNGQTTAGSFDGLGNKFTCTYPGGRVLSRTFDALERVKTISDGGGPLLTNYFFGPGIRVARKTYGTDVSRAGFGYDGDPGSQDPNDFGVERLVSLQYATQTSGDNSDLRTYLWDRASNRKQAIASAPRYYGYDSVNRLVASTNNTAANTSLYALDGVGNRTSGPDGATSGSFTMNPATPEPADQQMNQYTTSPLRTFLYDRNGNLTNFSGPPSAALVFNYRNELVEYRDVSGGGAHHVYKYDALGRRIQKTLNDDPAQTTRFFYDGSQEIEEQNGSGVTLGTYVYGSYIDEVVNMKRGTNSYFYHHDDQYNVLAVSDGSGIVERYEYLPQSGGDYGVPNISGPNHSPSRTQSAITNALLFQGRRYDAETGLYYFRSRHLDPRIGRFITRDLIGIWGDKANMGNGYAFVANNPLGLTDPLGLLARGGGGTLSYSCDTDTGKCQCFGTEDCSAMFGSGVCGSDVRCGDIWGVDFCVCNWGGRSPAIFASARTPSRAGFADIASSGARARRPFDPSLRTAGCSAQIPRLDARQQKPPFALRASSQPWPQIVGSDPVGGGGGGFGGTVILQPKRPSFFNTYADCLVDACGEAGGDWCEQCRVPDCYFKGTKAEIAAKVTYYAVLTQECWWGGLGGRIFGWLK